MVTLFKARWRAFIGAILAGSKTFQALFCGRSPIILSITKKALFQGYFHPPPPPPSPTPFLSVFYLPSTGKWRADPRSFVLKTRKRWASPAWSAPSAECRRAGKRRHSPGPCPTGDVGVNNHAAMARGLKPTRAVVYGPRRTGEPAAMSDQSNQSNQSNQQSKRR